MAGSVPWGGSTPQGLALFELQPGDAIDLSAIVETLEVDQLSGFGVEFTVDAYVWDDEDERYVRADPRSVETVEEAGASRFHSVVLPPVPLEPEERNWIDCSENLLFNFYVGCKLARGIETFGRSVGDLVVLAYQVGRGVARFGFWSLRTSVEYVMADTEAKEILRDEIMADLRDLQDRGWEAVQNIDLDAAGELIFGMIDGFITRLHDVLVTGDVKLIAGEIAEIAGENLDLTLELFVAARAFAKLSVSLGGKDSQVRDRLDTLAARQANEVNASVDQVISTKGHRALPESRVLPAGVDVTDIPKIWRDSYGITERNMLALKAIAAEFGVSITFRSRSPLSGRLIESRVALPKPQGIKTKGVNELDIDFLGYNRAWDSKVVIVEPPIPWTPPGPQRQQAIRNWMDTNPKLQGNSPEVIDLRNQVEARMDLRLDEWAEFHTSWKPDWERNGVKVDFDPEFNGAPRDAVRELPNRPVQLEPETLGDRAAYRVTLEAPPGYGPSASGSSFFDVTGDIDFLAILTPDGRILGDTLNPLRRVAELAQRKRIYEMMIDLVGMQHGESFSIARSKVRAKYVRDGVDAVGGETLLAVTPKNRVVTTYFDDTLSYLAGGPNSTLHDVIGARLFFGGVFTEALSPERALDVLTRDLLGQQFGLLRRVRYAFTASALYRVIDGISEADVSDEFDADGVAVRPDEAGGAEVYVAPGVETQSSSRSSGELSVRSSPAVANPTDPIVAELIAAGWTPRDEVGALGGRWTAVDPLALSAEGPFSMVPFTFLTAWAPAGSTEVGSLSRSELGVSPSGRFFEPGEVVVVDPGGSGEEFATVATVEPLSFEQPLVHTHAEQTMILLLTSSTAGLDLPPPGSIEPDPATPTDPDPDPGSGTGPTPSPVSPGPSPSPSPDQPPSPGAPPPSPPAVLPPGSSAEIPPGFESLVPYRLLDSRQSGRVGAGSVTEVVVAGRGGVPRDASAVVLNVTVADAGASGYATVFPCGGEPPEASNLNYVAGQTVPNAVVSKVGAGGSVCVFTFEEIDLLVDVNGAFP